MTGTILILSDVPAFHDACAYVQLEDVSYADRPAEIVARMAVPEIRHPSKTGSTRIPFVLKAERGWVPDPAADYVVRIWVDVDGDGQLGPGDLHSDQSHRVLTRGFGDAVTVEVRP